MRDPSPDGRCAPVSGTPRPVPSRPSPGSPQPPAARAGPARRRRWTPQDPPARWRGALPHRFRGTRPAVHVQVADLHAPTGTPTAQLARMTHRATIPALLTCLMATVPTPDTAHADDATIDDAPSDQTSSAPAPSTVREARRLSLAVATPWPVFAHHDATTPVPALRIGVNVSPRVLGELTGGSIPLGYDGRVSLLEAGIRVFMVEGQLAPYSVARAGIYLDDCSMLPKKVQKKFSTWVRLIFVPAYAPDSRQDQRHHSSPIVRRQSWRISSMHLSISLRSPSRFMFGRQ